MTKHTINCLKYPEVAARILVLSLLVAACLFGVLPLTPVAHAAEYDLVILNGRVMDPETKLDAVRNVGVKNGKIAVITKDKIKGNETIDAENHVVAPGFIDMHDHNTAAPFGQKLALRDGVTTPMELEAGIYPVDTGGQVPDQLRGVGRNDPGS